MVDLRSQSEVLGNRGKRSNGLGIGTCESCFTGGVPRHIQTFDAHSLPDFDELMGDTTLSIARLRVPARVIAD
jgi:hypothetical protein